MTTMNPSHSMNDHSQDDRLIHAMSWVTFVITVSSIIAAWGVFQTPPFSGTWMYVLDAALVFSGLSAIATRFRDDPQEAYRAIIVRLVAAAIAIMAVSLAWLGLLITHT